MTVRRATKRRKVPSVNRAEMSRMYLAATLRNMFHLDDVFHRMPVALLKRLISSVQDGHEIVISARRKKNGIAINCETRPVLTKRQERELLRIYAATGGRPLSKADAKRVISPN
jgi:hypothetical protein